MQDYNLITPTIPDILQTRAYQNLIPLPLEENKSGFIEDPSLIKYQKGTNVQIDKYAEFGAPGKIIEVLTGNIGKTKRLAVTQFIVETDTNPKERFKFIRLKNGNYCREDEKELKPNKRTVLTIFLN